MEREQLIPSLIINMEKEQLLPLLINHYENVIKEILDDEIGKTFRILNQTYTEFGICHCAFKIFNVYIYREQWVNNHLNHHAFYWYEVPDNLFTIEEVIESLQFRVDKMKEILATL